VPPRNPLDRALPWHALSADAALDALATCADGLTRDEAAARLAASGPNRLRPPPARGPLLRLLAQFHNVLIYVLLGAGVVAAALQHWIDSAVIFGVVVINGLIGFVQEGKAERALDAIRDLLAPTATLVRDGRRVVLPADDIVPGDVVLLQ
jgi:magnesium-transporting ATPase (P-type)